MPKIFKRFTVALLRITENVAGTIHNETVLTFNDHETKERSFCQSKMISDDAVQVLSSGGTLKLQNVNI